jgi:hypothetical protein
MSVVRQGTDLLDGLSRLSGQQRLLRAAAPLTVVVLLLLEAAAGGRPSVPYVLVIVVLGLLAALLPDSGAPLVVVLVLGFGWALGVPEALSGWVLLAALDLLALHVTCTLAAYGPPGLVLAPALLKTWLSRSAAAAAVTALVWLAARLLGLLHPASSAWLFGAALGLVVAWTAYLSRLLGGPGR